MCTIITKRQQKAVRTASKDIIVYKTGTESLISNAFRSKYVGYVYLPDILYETTFTFAAEDCVSDEVELQYKNSLSVTNRVHVVRGFHSFDSIERMNKAIEEETSDCGIVIGLPAKFIIPAGANYYINKVGNVVSNQIIFKNFI